ncbi:unnamed protein product, partial [Vitis vinifera]|uniref:O-fucosyltransferase family protein n=1 Tax=Vitis vinifera TaxID=29760 RepID=D7SQF3_VITVI
MALNICVSLPSLMLLVFKIYDFEKFIRSLGVVVRVAKDLPAEVSTGELKAVWVLNRASEDYMAAKIEPVFRTKRKLRLATYLPSITMRRAEDSRGNWCVSNVDTTIYLTQFQWHLSLDALRKIFPKTYTKEGVMPADKKAKFLSSENYEFEKVIDFYICSQSDVFVPSVSGLFYANAVGKRIASGKSQILVPAQVTVSSALNFSFISPYISRKNHFAYSCFC